MRLIRLSWLALAVVAACDHDQVAEIVTRDGESTIPVVEMNTAAAGNFLNGTRVVNTFVAAGPFDTAVTDAFALSANRLANLRTDAVCYGTDSLVRPWGGSPTTYAAPTLLLPAVIGNARAISAFGCGPLARIVPSGNTGNGTGNTVWEAWYQFDQLLPSTRYVMAFARYRLEQRGALDATEFRLTGAVTQPDSLVFDALNPAGRKAVDVFTTSCTNANIVQPIAGANPHLLGSDVTNASGVVDLDQTACANAASVWGGRTTSRTPIPANNATTIGANQYNFFVVWEALPDSTPDYSKPVYRQQIAPLLTQTGARINNAVAPLPEAMLTGLQLGPLPGSTSRPDTMKLTFNNLKPLVTGRYQVWLLRTDSAKSQLVTGRVVRLNGATVVDTLSGVSEFNTGGVITGARMEFDVGNFPGGFWNAVTLAVAGTTGNTTLPTSQPMWATSVAKAAGELANFSSALAAGSFNTGSGSRLFGVAGSAIGGIFGNELREDLKRLPRPPMGYMYEAWLTNTTDSTKRVNLGPILAPYPALTSLVDADVSQAPPLSGVEITQAAIRFVAGARTFYCDFDRVQVRLAPKNGDPAVLSPTILLSGGLPACP